MSEIQTFNMKKDFLSCKNNSNVKTPVGYEHSSRGNGQR